MCLISSRKVAKFCATPLTNVQSSMSRVLMVCWTPVSDVGKGVEKGPQAGKLTQLLEQDARGQRYFS